MEQHWGYKIKVLSFPEYEDVNTDVASIVIHFANGISWIEDLEGFDKDCARNSLEELKETFRECPNIPLHVCGLFSLTNAQICTAVI